MDREPAGRLASKEFRRFRRLARSEGLLQPLMATASARCRPEPTEEVMKIIKRNELEKLSEQERQKLKRQVGTLQKLVQTLQGMTLALDLESDVEFSLL